MTRLRPTWLLLLGLAGLVVARLGAPLLDGSGALGACGTHATPIHEVQGPGDASPLEGRSVVVEGVVVGAFQGREALEGFYLQEEDGDRDADPATSEGVFVFEGATPRAEVAVDDAVRAAGTVAEYHGLTELTDVTAVRVCGEGGEVTPTALRLPLDDAARERVENMAVTFPQALTVSGYHDFDRYGEIVLAWPLDGLQRPFQATAFRPPDEAAEVAAAQAQRRIVLDDGRSDQNPVPARHPDGAPFTRAHRFRGGDRVTGARGVLTYAFDRYRLQPTHGATHTAANPRPGAPPDVGGALTAAAFNVLNYFPTLGRRGADTPEAFARQRAKIVAALAALDADVVGLIEIENDARSVPHLVDALNDAVGSGTYAYVATGTIGPDAIKVALIYRPATVTPVGRHAVLDTEAFLDPVDVGEAQNRPLLAQTFEAEGGGRFTAAVPHLKSKGSPCGPGDDDPWQGNCHRTRTLAAEALHEWLGADPTGSGDPDVLLLGDLNAYDEEDPVRLLADAGWVDLGERAQGEFAYSYAFDGRFGHLDYALATASLAEQVTGAAYWPINADEPDLLAYDGRLAPAAAEAGPYRASDHDPVIVGLDLDDGGAQNTARGRR